jgi:hypothetical protein
VNLKDGNIGGWLDEQHDAIAKLSAKAIGFKVVPGWYETFSQSLAGNRDAERLNRDILPKCRAQLLAGFIVLTVSTNVEDRLVLMKKTRGQQLKSRLRAAARKVPGEPRAKEVLGNAEHAFDTRREGLAEHCLNTLIVRAYLHSKSGLEPTARELAALLSAGLAASAKAPFHKSIDHDLLRRNLKNFEKRRPTLARSARERSVDIIES